MSKLKLTLDEFTDDFFDDTRLLGITTSVKNYRFCRYLNQLLGYDFRLNPQIEIQLIKKSRTYYFPVYEHNGEANFLNHYVYHNHFDGEYLLPELRNMDFLWLMKGDIIEDHECLQIIQTIKNIHGVQLVVELTNEMIKNKENLMFE